MTTIVKHRRTGNHYILLSITGNKANPSRFISELFDRQKSEVSTAAVCDFQGNIFLAQIDELTVLEIDGKKPADLLPELADETTPENVYVEQSDDFDDEELEEEFDDEQDRAPTPADSGSFIYGQGSTAQSEVEDEEDWI